MKLKPVYWNVENNAMWNWDYSSFVLRLFENVLRMFFGGVRVDVVR